jgi:hypothetical protein
MALGLVIVGIVAGLLVAGSVLVLGGGIGLAVVAYIGAGLAGMLGGLASAFLPRHRLAVLVSQDRA